MLTIFYSEAVLKPIHRGTKELLPIDEKEFLTVSKLVRGRAKLHDVNKVCLKINNKKVFIERISLECCKVIGFSLLRYVIGLTTCVTFSFNQK